jgi:3-methylcrotonyl-CoA carboxylase alpha subunit
MPEVVLLIRGDPVRCDVSRAGEDFIVRVEGKSYTVQIDERGEGAYQVRIDGTPHLMYAVRGEDRGWVHVDGRAVAYESVEAGGAPVRAEAERSTLSSPMPGTVERVLVSDGDIVERGQALVIVEAMKMEHVIRAPRLGRVQSVRVRPGETVHAGVALVELADPADAPG